MKIVVILGFVFNFYDKIKVFVEVGVNVFWMNFSYGIYEDYVRVYVVICKIESDFG